MAANWIHRNTHVASSNLKRFLSLMPAERKRRVNVNWSYPVPIARRSQRSFAVGVPASRYPHYDTALLAAYYMYDHLLPLAPDEGRGALPQSLSRWSTTVAGNMAVIINAAYRGSVGLGSNIPGPVPVA
jgi:hypothetical protein